MNVATKRGPDEAQHSARWVMQFVTRGATTSHKNAHVVLGYMVVSLLRQTKVSGDVVGNPPLAQRLLERCYGDTHQRSHLQSLFASPPVTPLTLIRYHPRTNTHGMSVGHPRCHRECSAYLSDHTSSVRNLQKTFPNLPVSRCFFPLSSFCHPQVHSTNMSSILQYHSTTKQNGTAVYQFLTLFSSSMAELSSSTEGIWYLLLGRGRPWPVGTVSAYSYVMGEYITDRLVQEYGYQLLLG